jgi:hypothetical protein
MEGIKGKSFIITKKNGEKFGKMSPFLLKKLIDTAAGGEVETAKILSDGRISLLTKTEIQSKNIEKISKLGQDNVKVQEDDARNKSVGVIFCQDLKYSSDEEILENLNDQKVVGIRRVKKMMNQTEPTETGLYFITFDLKETPTQLKIGYEIVEVREFIPDPIRCFKCLKFGHTQRFCKSEEKKCANCSNPEHVNREMKEKCQNPPKCSGCGDSHHSFSKNCDIYRMEKEIIAIKTKMKLPYPIARQMFMTQNPLSKRTFAKVTAELETDAANSTKNPSVQKAKYSQYTEYDGRLLRSKMGASGNLAPTTGDEKPIDLDEYPEETDQIWKRNAEDGITSSEDEKEKQKKKKQKVTASKTKS